MMGFRPPPGVMIKPDLGWETGIRTPSLHDTQIYICYCTLLSERTILIRSVEMNKTTSEDGCSSPSGTWEDSEWNNKQRIF